MAPVSYLSPRTQAVQSAHTDSSASANSITERSVLLGTDLTELVSGGAGGTYASGRTPPAQIGQEEIILNWLADGGACGKLQHPRRLHAVRMN